ncbi:MAG: type II secretion system ATPase GspE [Sphingomonadales bacterium]
MAINAGAALAQPPADFASYLLQQDLIAADALDRAMRAATQTATALPAALVDLGLLSDGRCAEALAAFTGAPLCEDAQLDAADASAGQLPERFLRENHILPLFETDAELSLAMADPSNGFALKALKLATRKPLALHTAARGAIDRALERCFAEQKTAIIADSGPRHQDLDRLRDLASEAPVIRRVSRLIDEAVARRASDIHIEQHADTLRVRYRIDGKLIDADAIASSEAPAVLSRLKLLAHMDIAESRLPQDGRIRTSAQGTQIDLRVATLPSVKGETMVIRVLDRAAVALDLPRLGFGDGHLPLLRSLLRRPNGIFLVTGPTGSGKTTTLYAALAEVNRADVKIITIEDPVEYDLEGVVQIQVKPQIGLDFADVLRATLRHNPDILLIGEIRDVATARLAIEASLTGHLVLATLHTNSAPASISRLLDMGVEDYLLASTLAGVLAQRLVRRLCPACRQRGAMPEGLGARLRAELGDGDAVALDQAALYQPQQGGCGQCRGSGYRGRTTIAELMLVDEPVRAAIYQRADAHHMAAAARAQHFRTMRQNGLAKALAGETSLEEIFQATQEG